MHSGTSYPSLPTHSALYVQQNEARHIHFCKKQTYCRVMLIVIGAEHDTRLATAAVDRVYLDVEHAKLLQGLHHLLLINVARIVSIVAPACGHKGLNSRFCHSACCKVGCKCSHYVHVTSAAVDINVSDCIQSTTLVYQYDKLLKPVLHCFCLAMCFWQTD